MFSFAKKNLVQSTQISILLHPTGLYIKYDCTYSTKYTHSNTQKSLNNYTQETQQLHEYTGMNLFSQIHDKIFAVTLEIKGSDI